MQTMQNQLLDQLSGAENPPKNAEEKENKVSRAEPDTAGVNDENVERYTRNKESQNRMNNRAGKQEFLTNNNVREREN